MFPLRSASWIDDVMWCGNYVIALSGCHHESWISWYSHDVRKRTKIDSKFTKIAKKIRMLKWSKTGGEGTTRRLILDWRTRKFKFWKACLSNYGCHGSDKVGEHEALTSKHSQLNFGKGHQIWWLLSFEWFRNLTFGCSINSSYYGHDHPFDHPYFFFLHWLPPFS